VVSLESEESMKIVYVPTLNVGVCYWRIENYALELLKLHPATKVHVAYMPGHQEQLAWDKLCIGFDDTSKDIQMRLESCFKTFDVVIFQKIQYPEALALIEQYQLEFPDVLVLAEVDDSIGHVGPSNPHLAKFAEHHRWAAEQCARADGVITSTDYLKKTIGRFNDHVHVAPNCINWDVWKYKRKKQKPSSQVRIGYVGAAAHDEDLMIAYKAILPLLTDHNIKFVIRYGGFRPDWLKRHDLIDFKRVAWHLNEYPQKLVDMNLNLAVAPLRDTEFNRCKSNLKWVEWSSVGVPLLASKVAPYKGTKGSIHLVSNSVTDWTSYIVGLLPHLRNNLDLDKDLIEENKNNYNLEREARGLVDWLYKHPKMLNFLVTAV